MTRRNPDLEALRARFGTFELVKDVTDQLIDLMLNLRQSGHPGGSRSKVHALVGLFLSGALRLDLRDPTRPWADRFVLAAGHTAPAAYALLAVLFDALRQQQRATGDARFGVRDPRFALYPEHLAGFRRRGGLPGHVEMAGRTLILRANAGPSGHGLAFAAGQALALRYAGADDALVWALEGEGGLTTGVTHEVLNSAWGLGLGNLRLLVDWNDFGIDPRPASAVVHGTPVDWIEPHGWEVLGTPNGNDWEGVAALLAEMVVRPRRKNPIPLPVAGWLRTQKGRGYLVYDAASHGTPHKRNSEHFWETKRPFQDRYGVRFEGFGEPDPGDEGARAQFDANVDVALSVLRRDARHVAAVAGWLVEAGDAVPVDKPAGVWVDFGRDPLADPTLFDATTFPGYKRPGARVSTRQAFAATAAWLNATCLARHGRPLFLAASADLAESTGVSGFAEGIAGLPGCGWYERQTARRGAVLPQEITEALNAGMLAGLATVNFSDQPLERFAGFFGAASTYGAFAYLKYGMVRLFSQMAQDSEQKMGRFLWVVGHSGPETADDSRTHFGVFAPGVTRLLPKGQVVNLHPFEANEVPVLLAAALRGDAPVIALHLARPPLPVPDRAALGLPTHHEAARGAWLIRRPDPARPVDGTVLVQGVSTTHALLDLLPTLDERGFNLRVVALSSAELFEAQDQAYRDQVLPWAAWLDSMVITSGALTTMGDWVSSRVAADYSLAADWDGRWRTGGTLDEVLDEAHLAPPWLLAGIERFVADRDARRARLVAVAGAGEERA